MLGFDRSGRRAGVLRGCAGVLTACVALTGCTAGGGPGGGDPGGGDPGGTAAPPPLRPRLATPPAPTTVVPAAGAVGLAAAATAALFEHAPVVVVAPEDDVAAQARAASAAVSLGSPLLVTPGPSAGGAGRSGPAPAPGAEAAGELARLSPRSVLAFSEAAGEWARHHGGDVRVVAAPADPGALRALDGLDLGEQQPVAPGALAASAAALPRERTPLLALEAGGAPAPAAGGAPAAEAGAGGTAPGAGGTAPGAGGTAPGGAPAAGPPAPAEPLPAVAPAARPDDLLVLVESADAGVAAVATARASGARVVPVAGTDPRADGAARAALAASPLPERVVALGDFGSADLLRRRLEVAATGVELPGGGQVLFPGRRMVALYGHPGAPVLGVLGEQPVGAAVARAQELAAGYTGLVGEPVVPAFEIITTVASAGAGPDGNYSAESEVADLRPWVDEAGRAGVYVVLDLQPGRTDFLTQARRYEELLAEPHVGLALDPEWRLGPDQRHLAQIGSVGVDEVNAVAAWLAELTRAHRLPQKLLLLHQFQLRMIGDRGRLDTTHDELAVLIHADGFGTPGQKLETWRTLRQQPPAGAWWGWKNFIDEDRPTFTPAETVAVEPTPWFVSYQ